MKLTKRAFTWVFSLIVLATLFTVAPVSQTKAQFGGCLPAFCTSAAPTVSCVEATTFLARTSGLNATHQNAYKSLICGLVIDGVWPKLLALYQFATQDQTTANLNLVSVSFTVAPQASPTWIMDRGYAGVESSTTVYLATGLTPGTGVFTFNDAHLSVWSNSSGLTAGTPIGYSGGPGNGGAFVIPRRTGDLSYFAINSASGLGATVASTNGLGHYIANYDSGTTLTGYKNGSIVVGPVADTFAAPWGGPVAILAANLFPGSIGFGSATQISSATIGGPLTVTDAANLYARERAYMTTMGIP
jgi:hypothetical protein